jgi:hypothetical protein
LEEQLGRAGLEVQFARQTVHYRILCLVLTAIAISVVHLRVTIFVLWLTFGQFFDPLPLFTKMIKIQTIFNGILKTAS